MVEADLHRHYQVDLLDLFRGTLSWRKARVLIEQLPGDAATRYAVAETEPPTWDVADHLLAITADRVGDLIWLLGTVHSEKNKGPKRPPRIPRPGDEDRDEARKVPTIRPSELRRWLTTGEVTHG